MKNLHHKCAECDNVYKNSSSFNRHIRNKHVNKNEKCGYKNGVVCSLCGVYSISKSLLHQYLSVYHDCVIEEEIHNFSSESDFLAWKASIEKKTVSLFVKKRVAFILNDVKTSHFYCHHSGHFSSQGEGKRDLKSMGCNIIGGTCPVMLTVKEGKGGVHVVYVKTHVGHSNDLGKLNLTETVKKSIAAKLAKKMPISAVLDDIRDSISDKLE